MKMFLLVLFFGAMAGAADKALVKITSFTHDELAQDLVFERFAEKDKLNGRKKQYFEIGKTGALCEISFLATKATVGCEITSDGKDRVTTESGVQISTVVDCEKEDTKEISFSVKPKKSEWHSIKIQFQCKQSEKI